MPGQGTEPEVLLELRARKTGQLETDVSPPIPEDYLERAWTHSKLGYHDLAASDAYRAIALTTRYQDQGEEQDEHEEQVLGALIPSDEKIAEMTELLALSLVQCGCTRDAWELMRTSITDRARTQNERTRRVMQALQEECYLAAKESKTELNANFDTRTDYIQPQNLRSRGFVRREVYPWNTHEPDRSSEATLKDLNEKLFKVAPLLEVRSVSLPKLHGYSERDATSDGEETSIQLGLFAKIDIAPGQTILQETSVLTATNRFYDEICDACKGPLPGLDAAESRSTQCDECFDTVYCSPACRSLAAQKYHPAICGNDYLVSVGTDNETPQDADDALYLNLVARVIAMAQTQDTHPLDLPEIKYLWGDFDPLPRHQAAAQRLPFSFKMNIVQPMRILEEMDLDSFEVLPKYDTWVINTLYAKFRAVASARQSSWDGMAEVSVVHPLWCLANHSCDPNVQWECEGDIKFIARTERMHWRGREEKKCQGGIRRGEEVLNHYCDVALDFRERRLWAMAALGGDCRCDRCVWEEMQEC